MSNIVTQLLDEQYRLEVLADFLLDDAGAGTVDDYVDPLGSGDPIKPRTEELNGLVDKLLGDAGLDGDFKDEFLADVVVDTEKIDWKPKDKEDAKWAKVLTADDVREIRRALKSGYYFGQYKHLAWRFGVTYANITAIRDGRIFAHVK